MNLKIIVCILFSLLILTCACLFEPYLCSHFIAFALPNFLKRYFQLPLPALFLLVFTIIWDLSKWHNNPNLFQSLLIYVREFSLLMQRNFQRNHNLLLTHELMCGQMIQDIAISIEVWTVVYYSPCAVRKGGMKCEPICSRTISTRFNTLGFTKGQDRIVYTKYAVKVTRL